MTELEPRGEDMATSLANDYRVRKSFGKIKQIVDIPNLIEMQRQSYERFLQQGADPDERVDKGLQGVFKGVFPIRDFSGTASLEFVRYSIGGRRRSEPGDRPRRSPLS